MDLRTNDRIPNAYDTVNGLMNGATRFDLCHHCCSRPHLGTAIRIADDLRRSVSFLVNARNLTPFIDDRDRSSRRLRMTSARSTGAAGTPSPRRPTRVEMSPRER